MNYRRISLAVIAATMIGGVLLQDLDIKNNRYHQHMDAKEKAVCTEHGEDVFCTHLPLMHISLENNIPASFPSLPSFPF